MSAAPKPIGQRFMDKVSVGHDGGCWLWIGQVVGRGYGRFWGGEYTPDGNPCGVLAHRWSYEHFVGPLPPREGPGATGLCVLHRCDTPACVNPAHLFLGTQHDNVQDCIRKGRRARTVVRKLTPQQRGEIADRHRAGALQEALAAEYGVSQQTISDIATGRTLCQS